MKSAVSFQIPSLKISEKEGESNQRQQEKQAIKVCDSFYLHLAQLVMCYEHYNLHVAFLARERNEPAKTTGRKQAFKWRKRLPSARVTKHLELAYKRSVKRPKCQKTSLIVGSKDPSNCYIVNNCHHQRCKNQRKAVCVVA